MDSTRKTALVAGILYLVTFISSIPAFFLLEPVLSHPDYITGAGADTQVAFGALLDLVNALAAIGTAVALFSVVRRQHEGLALGFVATRMFEATVIAIGVVSILSVVTLRQDGAASGDDASLLPVGQALVAVHDWTQIIGPGMAGLNALLLGTLMYRSGLVPRWIPAIGLIGGPVYLSAVIGIILGVTEDGSAWQAIGGAPMFVWELALGLWMTFKGFKPSPITSTGVPPVPAQAAVSVA
ncbi:MAG: DUF4386 domain-containing protein [Sporichthyaceae bacterium]